MYKVTLAIPVYNVEKYIERALLSALNQTFDSIEYLLIDDRGTDNSMNIAIDIIKNHPRAKDVRIIDHEVNRGLGIVRNTAIEKAQGEYIYYMDSDDEITLDCISILYNKMIEYPVDFVAASHVVISSDGQTKDMVVYEDCLIEKDEFAVARAYYMKKRIITVNVVNKLYDLEFLKKNNIKCEQLMYEDNFFTYQVILNAQSCRLLSNMSYLRYTIEDSIMSKTREYLTPKMAKQFEGIFCSEKKYLRKYHQCDFYNALVERTYSYALYHAFLIYNSKIASKEKKSYISSILEYPLSFKEIVITKNKYHFIMYGISKIPNTNFKFFLHKSISFLLRLKTYLIR
jgi:glycosyltransferase involved in cell wall biosynthesis